MAPAPDLHPPPPPSSASPIRVVSGATTALRLFDVAYEIDTDRVEALLGSPPALPVSRVQLSGAQSGAIAFAVAPLELSLGPLTLATAHGALPAEVGARVYDFGVVSVSVQVPAADLAWDAWVARCEAVAEVLAWGAGDALWHELLQQVLVRIGPALDRPTPPGLAEDYLLAVVERLDPPLSGEELPERVDLAPLLAGERRRLAASARADLLENRHSFYEDDLVVLAWERAFLLEPSGSHEVADVLEVANAQLLELRYYDELLDRQLPIMYDRVAGARKRLRGLGRGRYAALARELHTLVGEVTEITERVDNALKVTEDVYLARVYGTALELFRVDPIASAVDRKLSIIRDTYQALYDEAAAARAEVLEVAIVLLFIVDILIYFL